MSVSEHSNLFSKLQLGEGRSSIANCGSQNKWVEIKFYWYIAMPCIYMFSVTIFML